MTPLLDDESAYLARPVSCECRRAHILIAGREREYISYSIKSRIVNAGATSAVEMDQYAAYRAPGALRAALEIYRALPRDRELNLYRAGCPSGIRLIGYRTSRPASIFPPNNWRWSGMEQTHHIKCSPTVWVSLLPRTDVLFVCMCCKSGIS
jgi:hypothetical protein